MEKKKLPCHNKKFLILTHKDKALINWGLIFSLFLHWGLFSKSKSGDCVAWKAAGVNFQIYLELFAGQDAEELKIIVFDNGAFHKAKSLKIPENIIHGLAEHDR